LSDTGNVWSVSLGTWPAYGENTYGRFSNGLKWIDYFNSKFCNYEGKYINQETNT
jgi:hypothetical protein